jgi:peptidoglycan/xylan/chitin deacetylase (PgdA/CDA1 family)
VGKIRWFHWVSIAFLALLLVLLFLVYLVKDCHSDKSQTLVAPTFDDGYSCWTSTVMPILEHYDLPGTAFINDPDYREDFTWTAVQELYNAGWEIGWHTAGHIDVSMADRSEIISDFNDCGILFKAHGLPTPVAFAYPFGGHSHNAMNIVSDYFLAARTIHHGVNSPCYIRENPAHLTAINLDKGLPFIKGVVNKYSQQGVLIVLFAHTVGQISEWQVSPEMTVPEFEDFAGYLHQKEKEGCIDVVTFSEGVRRMKELQDTSHWYLQLDSPFNPWYEADDPPIPERYSTLYDILVHNFLEHRYPQIALFFDRLVYGTKHVGFFLACGLILFIMASIVITIVSFRRKDT